MDLISVQVTSPGDTLYVYLGLFSWVHLIGSVKSEREASFYIAHLSQDHCDLSKNPFNLSQDNCDLSENPFNFSRLVSFCQCL